jgi:hypothetical protein
MPAKYISRDDVVTPEEYPNMGGKPSKATPADQRLAANKAKAAAGKPPAPTGKPAFPGARAPFKAPKKG